MVVLVASGAPAREAEGRRPREPGMTDDSSERLWSHANLSIPASFYTLLNRSHITEHVLGQQDTVQLPRVRNHDHSGRVDQLVFELELRVFLRHELCHRLSPESRCGEDVGLVDGCDGEGGFSSESNLSGDSSDSLHFEFGVDTLVPCDTFLVGFLTFTEV